MYVHSAHNHFICITDLVFQYELGVFVSERDEVRAAQCD